MPTDGNGGHWVIARARPRRTYAHAGRIVWHRAVPDKSPIPRDRDVEMKTHNER